MYSPASLKSLVFNKEEFLQVFNFNVKAGFHPSVKIFKRSSLFLPTRKAP